MTRRAAILLLGVLPLLIAAAPAPEPFVPHYLSQRPAQAAMREGPSYDHKVLWVYRHKGYPFRAVASFDIWRRVQAADGTLGWMSMSMLSDARTVLVTGKGRAQIRASADPASKLAGLADPDAILGLKTCVRDFCRVAADGIDGWIARPRIWGVGADEIFH
jgi:SH3-like domain-containing protein